MTEAFRIQGLELEALGLEVGLPALSDGQLGGNLIVDGTLERLADPGLSSARSACAGSRCTLAPCSSSGIRRAASRTSR